MTIDPVIYFFMVGLISAIFKIPIRLPRQIAEFATYFLLITIGLKGGIEFRDVSVMEVLPKVLAVALMGFILPIFAYPVLKTVGKLQRADAASIAAHYGSVSVATFAVCVAFLQEVDVTFESYMPLFVVILEIPAIIVGVGLAKNFSLKLLGQKELVQEVFLGKSIILLLFGLFLGQFSNDKGLAGLEKFFIENFKGVLGLFLLEMGFLAAKEIKSFKTSGMFLVVFGMIMPLFSSVIGVGLGYALGLSVGGTTILACLAASASYIAVPAAMKISVPEANPTLSIGASLGITFPFNVVVGIPLYYQMTLALYAQ